MRHIQQLWLVVLCLSLLSPGIARETVTLPKGILQLAPYSAPPLELKDLDGEPYNLKEDNGVWVFVHFWASWCGPCRKEMPAIQNMANTLQAEGLKLAMINTAEDEDTVFSFLSAHAPEVRPLMDRDGQVTEKWHPRGLPATYLVDPTGQVRYQALGGRAWDSPPYLAFLRRLLQNQ
jgi:thiol-disulfide isomerase/thioredoxin